jgi:heat shock protein HslJ
MAALLVATSSACGSAKQMQHERSASSSAAAAGVGHKWRLTRVTVTGGMLDVPDLIDATFQLTSDGRFLASDSVNALSGTYTTANRIHRDVHRHYARRLRGHGSDEAGSHRLDGCRAGEHEAP